MLHARALKFLCFIIICSCLLTACSKTDGEEDFIDCDFQPPVLCKILLKSSATNGNLLDPAMRYNRDSIKIKIAYAYRGAVRDSFLPASIDTAGEDGIRLTYAQPTNCPSTKNDVGRWLEALIRLDAGDTDTFSVERLASKNFEYRYNGAVVPAAGSDYGALIFEIKK